MNVTFLFINQHMLILYSLRIKTFKIVLYLQYQILHRLHFVDKMFLAFHLTWSQMK